MTSKRILVYLMTVLTFVLAKRPFTFNVNEISCIRYADPVSVFECHLDTIDNETVISGHMMFLEDVNDVQVKVNVDLLSSAGTRMNLFDTTVDGCKMLAAVDLSAILKFLMMHLKRVGHFPEGCPVIANENYTLNKFALDADIFPPYTPEFNYVTEVSMMIKSNIIAKILAKGNVQTKKKSLFLRT